MELIDWPGVARNALWILGLSIALAAWSQLSWWAAAHHVKIRRALNFSRFQAPFSAGLTLFCASLAWGAVRWWERGLWIILGLAFLWQTISAWRFAATYGWNAAPEDRAPEVAAEAERAADKPA